MTIYGERRLVKSYKASVVLITSEGNMTIIGARPEIAGYVPLNSRPPTPPWCWATFVILFGGCIWIMWPR